MVAATLGERHPDAAGGLAILDAAPVPHPDLVDALLGFTTVLGSETTFREDLRLASDAFFSPFDDATRKAKIQAGVYAPRHVMMSCAAAMEKFVRRALETDIPAAWSVPACNIAGMMQMNDMHRFMAMCPELLSAQVLGAGHWYMLEVPDQLNAMLERFLLVMQRSALRPNAAGRL
jgi:pimeloyl-ACP methyl ester carboxylesterase